MHLLNDEDLKNKDIPAFQKLFDRPFLWLIVGFITMAVFYTIWGIYEIYTLPMATLP